MCTPAQRNDQVPSLPGQIRSLVSEEAFEDQTSSNASLPQSRSHGSPWQDKTGSNSNLLVNKHPQGR